MTIYEIQLAYRAGKLSRREALDLLMRGYNRVTYATAVYVLEN
jgi:hypothetical protein